MKHIKHAKIELENGNPKEALRIAENVLGLAPNNPEALLIKAKVIDSWGHFDESFKILQGLAQQLNDFPELRTVIVQRAADEHDGLIFCEMSKEGRWFYPLPKGQILMSLLGFIGCGLFLFAAPDMLHAETTQQLKSMLNLFSLLVLLPWAAIMTLHVVGIKKIHVGMSGIKICKRFQSQTIPWSKVTSVGLVYQHSKLFLFIYGENKQIVQKFDVSAGSSVVRARRQFVRQVVAFADVVTYIQHTPTNVDINADYNNEEDLKKSA